MFGGGGLRSKSGEDRVLLPKRFWTKSPFAVSTTFTRVYGLYNMSTRVGTETHVVSWTVKFRRAG